MARSHSHATHTHTHTPTHTHTQAHTHERSLELIRTRIHNARAGAVLPLQGASEIMKRMMSSKATGKVTLKSKQSQVLSLAALIFGSI
jgi:hypothetical protein